ncbi:S1 family peptidase [Paraglaciecola arctica]|uniref:Serine protease n=1 Tax=Paraglaciecola arctica BSs20135 TaxID=493475 RepID=K6YLG4_9ALTE|nr:serine protease [Paraglaciecola arctica]GAC19007.1 hypothetical protein GARC_2040 [Paraglaciecola arctica BSs20135]
MLQFRHSLLPLFAVNLKNGIPNDPRQLRYLGVSYHVNDQGVIATCKHVVEAVQDGETLVGMEIYGDCLTYKINDLRCHPKYDFAIGFVERKNYRTVVFHGKKEIFIGDNILAYGFTNEGIVNGVLTTAPRLFKGHIVRTHHTAIVPDTRSTCEISFPALKGFSGTPLLFDKAKSSMAGMLFSNLESTIELHSFSEIEENGEQFSEKIHKVIELGLVHTAYDIRHYLNDLGINRVPFDAKEYDEIET